MARPSPKRSHPMFPPPDRRRVLRTFANGFGLLGLAGLLADEARARTPGAATPRAPPPPHFAPKAKRPLFLFMAGGPSHVDTSAPKPRLATDAGKPLPFPQPALVRPRTA